MSESFTVSWIEATSGREHKRDYVTRTMAEIIISQNPNIEESFELNNPGKSIWDLEDEALIYETFSHDTRSCRVDNNDDLTLQAYRKGHDNDATLEEALGAFQGRFGTEAEFAKDLYEKTGNLNNVSPDLIGCIDWQLVWESELRHYFFAENNFFFRRK